MHIYLYTHKDTYVFMTVKQGYCLGKDRNKQGKLEGQGKVVGRTNKNKAQ